MSADRPSSRVLVFAVGSALLGGGASTGCASKDNVHVNEGPEPEPKTNVGREAEPPAGDDGEPAGAEGEPEEHVNVGPKEEPEPPHVNEGPQPEPKPQPKPTANPGPQPDEKPAPK